MMQRYAGAKSEIKTIKFWPGKYQLDRANIFMQIGRPAKALECLDDAERYITKKRLLVYLNILRAKCYIEQKKPNYEYGIKILEGAIIDSNTIKVQRHINHIKRLYSKLVASSYGNSPDVADLGLMLQELRGMNN